MELKKAFSALKIYLLLLCCYIFGISPFFTVFGFSFSFIFFSVSFFSFLLCSIVFIFSSWPVDNHSGWSVSWLYFSFLRTEYHFEIKNIATCNSLITQMCMPVQFTILLFASIVVLRWVSFGELHLPIFYIVTPILNDILCHRGYLLLFASVHPHWKLS